MARPGNALATISRWQAATERNVGVGDSIGAGELARSIQRLRHVGARIVHGRHCQQGAFVYRRTDCRLVRGRQR